MKKGFLRSTLALFLLLSFSPSLLYCGQVNLAPELMKLVMEDEPPPPQDRWEYVPIVPPETTSGFMTGASESTAFLGDLPIDQVMARDLINKLLGAFLIEFNDEIANLLKSFGIELPADFTTLPLKYILQFIKIRSYDQELANQLLAQWGSGMTPEQEESLRRFWLSQTVVKTGFDSALAMTEDATEGLYDLIDLIYGATNVMKKISKPFEGLPLIGAIIRKIRIMISQRVVFALNNGVDLITSKMKEPARSRVRSIATALTTTYIKWTGIKVGDGFGGISSELLTKIGAKMLGKFLLLWPPKIGYTSRTKEAAQYGAERALAQGQTGTFAEAAVRVLDDGDDAAEGAVLEAMRKTVLKKQKLSHQERQIANVAGSISQIAQLVHFIDPSSFARIVAIGAAILAGGLQLHTVFNSSVTLYRIPGQVDQGVRLAFDPSSAPLIEDDEPAETSPASGEYVQFLQARIRAADEQFKAAVEAMTQAVDGTDMEAVSTALDTLEGASREVRMNVKYLSTFKIDADGGPDEMKSILAEGMMDHDLSSAGVYADTLSYVFRPRPATRQKIQTKLAALQTATTQFLSRMEEAATSSRMYEGAYVAVVAPSAAFAGEEIEIFATVVSAGTLPTQDVVAKLILPTGYVFTSGTQAVHTATSLAPGGRMDLKWVVQRPGGEFKKTSFIVDVRTGNAPEANHCVMITE